MESREDTPLRDQALIFLHLPKCGGTTLNRIIEWEYNPLRIFSVDPSFFRWSYQKLKRLSPQRLSAFRVFKGHMPFGIHQRLTHPATYITVMRDPIDRAISEYYFALNYRLHPEHRMMQQLSLDDYIRKTTYLNVQTKMIAGVDSPYDFLSGECTSETFARAKENLSKYFSVVGVTERFDEALALSRVLFGWNITKYADFNVTRSRPPKGAIQESTMGLIAERYRYDLDLYRYASELFEQSLRRHSAEVQKSLADIRKSRSLGPIESAYYRVASAARKAISRARSAL